MSNVRMVAKVMGCLVLTKKCRKLNTCMTIAAEDRDTLRKCSGKHAYANKSVRMQTF